MKQDNTNIQIEQQKKLKKIGAELQAIRLERGVSLETISSQTLISIRILKAIESGDVQELPEPIYIQALVKKFAATIHAEIDLDLTTIPTSPKRGVFAPPKSVVKRKSFWGRSLFPFQLRSTHLYLLYIAVIGASLGIITGLVERPTIVQNTQVKELIPNSSSVAIENTNQNNQSLSISKVVSESDKSVVVDITLKDRCWLKVMVDGEIDFEGILPKGTHRTWVGNEQITLRAGNAGGVVVTFNDGQKKILGQPGQVQEVTYKNREI
ncbi:hypothetical protein Sta7437_0021 [Stanieria cyanosphaera PCC 7437]|uniref:Cytoskeleton protein RodZ-like C-terminal domain-containing protein n=1 Tax=Stanieria cyanosphaera (strain ATCC 29371 / PCC 7437) TaxID=111780 RepID=K9XPQ7_STAC7|nr:RodZ domain-containing protein [Stanieria cyanosphaera]AFZ33647.1 hypothetical protein Sta7437_0021 [Stanieria cyanosphaera PCC 7437]